MSRRKTDHVVKAGTQSSSDPYKFILSTETADRMGDIIRVKGWDLSAFKQNPIALFGHNSNFPIGTWKDVKVVGKRLIGTLELAAEGTSDRIDEVRRLIEQRILKAVSVGLSIKEYEPIDKNDPWGGWDILKSELHETSVVAVPANAEALSVAKSMGVSDDTLDAVFGRKGKIAPAGRTKGVSAPQSNPRSKGKPMARLSDKIKNGKTRLDELKGHVEEITTKAADDGDRELFAEETEMLEDYAAQIEGLEGSIKGWEVAEKALGQRTAATGGEGGQKPSFMAAATAKKDKPGDLLIRAAVCSVIGYEQKRNPADVAKERYGSDPRMEHVVPLMTAKSDTTVATTTVQGWASELVHTDTVGFIDSLMATSIYSILSGAGVAIPFDNFNSITIPSRNGKGQVAGSFVQENATIPVKEGSLTSTTLNRFKLAVISTFTNELASVSNPQIEALLRQMISDDTSDIIDSHVMGSAAGVAGVRPPGIFNGAATQASAGATLEHILTDLRFLMDSLTSQNAFRNPAIIMNPARVTGLSMLTNSTGAFVFRSEIAGGQLFGMRLIVSTNMPAAIVGIVDQPDFATAFGNPSFMTSEHASLVMVDDDGTDPSMYHATTAFPDVDVAGSVHPSDAALVTGGPAVVRSMLQTNATALRMLLPISWAMMRPTTSYLTAVSW